MKPGANGVWRLVTQVQPPQRAAVHLALAKAVHSVFLCYLRAAGAAEDSHASKAAVRSPMLRGHTWYGYNFVASHSARLSGSSMCHKMIAWGLTCSRLKQAMTKEESKRMLEQILCLLQQPGSWPPAGARASV